MLKSGKWLLLSQHGLNVGWKNSSPPTQIVTDTNTLNLRTNNMNIELKITDKTNIKFPIIIEDKKGNIIYRQNENGFWYECTYNNNNNELTYKDSEGYGWEFTYDDNGNELTWKNSDGIYKIKDKFVTKEEFEVFVNGIPEYTMEELVAKLGHNFKLTK